MLQLINVSTNLSSLECVGPNYTKSFTIENDSITEDIILTLDPMGSTAFSLFPGANGHTNVIQASITPGSLFTFTINCIGAEDGDYTGLTCSKSILNLSNDTVLGPTTSINFTAKNLQTSTKRELGCILLKDKNDNPIVQQSDKSLEFTATSFSLARTNPKLTGNIKITVDSNEDIWLNSIDATKELADRKFKKFSISPNSSYAIDIKTFFDGGTTPTEQVFALYQNDTQYTSTKRTLAEQFDKFYQYGVEALSSKLYDEDFSFFAPICIKENIPEYFVIFRTLGPVNAFSYNSDVSTWSTSVISEILANSSIIKTFSLKDNSSIGKYLRNIVNHPARKTSELTVSYNVDGYTSFNGISYKDGSFAQKGELLYDYYQQENPIMLTDEYLTLGFERNGMVSSNILNIEFLFDDTSADVYSINRYFGLYVNASDLAKFDLDENGFVQYSKQIGQTPYPRKGRDATKTSLSQFIQTNENGIRLYVDGDTVTRDIPTDVFSSKVDSVAVGATTAVFSLPGDVQRKLIIGETCQLNTAGGATGTCRLINTVYDDNTTYATFLSGTFTGSFGLNMTNTIEFQSDKKYHDYNLDVMADRFIDSGRLFYIKDHDDNFHTVKSTARVTAAIDEFTQRDMVEITLHEKSLDITKFTGFLDIITQSYTTVLDSKGKSSIYMNISSYFSPNDYLEIRFSNTPTTGGFPLRWRVIANASSLQPGESWPSYGINTDTEGEYYFSYFNPGDSSINMNVFVSSIKSAFDRFPFKNFEVIAKDSTLYFRSNEEGISSEKSSLSFKLNHPSFTVMGVTAPVSGSVNFIGGSDRKRVRAKLDKNIANGMLLDEYVSTQGNFSRCRQYNIFNEVVISCPYLEEPIYNSAGEIIDFNGADIFHVIVLDDESLPIQTTYDKKLTSYELFRPSYGILSVLPFRDFDMDFHSSDYTRSYTPELKEYFGRYTSELSITDISSGLYTFDKSITISSTLTTPFLLLSDDNTGEPILFSNIQLKFDQTGATATAIGATSNTPVSIPGATVGTKILLMPDKKGLYFSENELAKFKGFFSLTGVITPEDEAEFNVLEKLWDPSRFTFQLLDTEYGRFMENYLKTLCLKSRVVPYISKWVYNGKDIRDNDYRLNYSRAFGTMNFSPSMTQVSADPKSHTHEWTYLDSVPDTFSINDFQSNVFSYQFNTISSNYDFVSTDIDWFAEYFNTGYPTELYKSNGSFTNCNLDIAEKYTIFKYEDFTDKTFTMFRGQRIEISNTVNSMKYDGYRYSVITKMEPSDYTIEQDPINFKTIINEKWKFIVTIITIRTSSYRFPNGRLSYTDLYTLDNSNTISIINGSADSLLQSYRNIAPNDQKLSDKLDFYSSDADSVYSIISNNDSFIVDLQEEILLNANGRYNSIYVVDPYSVAITEEVKNVEKNTVELSSHVLHAYFTPTTYSTLLPSSLPWSRYLFFHQDGGNDALLGLRDRLSFTEISKVITNDSARKSTMEYEILKSDFSLTTTVEDGLLFKMISPEQLIRTYDYIPTMDFNKPHSFFTSDTIGAVLTQIKNLQTLYRYQGNFSPKFRDILKFQIREDNDFTSVMSTDFLKCNTHLGTTLSNFSILKNEYFNKVSSSEILTISTNEGFQPVYPLVDEISIDKKDSYAWSSNWDKNYYRYYDSTSSYTGAIGTSSMKEIKSMFGSKCMKVPKAFDLYEFKTSKVTNLSELTSNELTYIDYGDKCLIHVNVYDRLLREMLGDSVDLKAKTEFLNAMNIIPETFTLSEIDAKTTEYLIQNIMSLYEIQDVKLYILQTGVSDTGHIATIQNIPRPVIETVNGLSLTETSLLSKEYLERKNAKLLNKGNMIIEIDYPFDSRYYTSLSLGVSIKRI